MEKGIKKVLAHVFLCLMGILMVYPLLWLFFSSFKSNNEIFSSLGLLPRQFTIEPYIKGWNGVGRYSFSEFFLNTFKIVIPSLVLILVSTTLVAYGFARFKFPMKKLLFTVMLSTLMLPASVVIIPKYLLFRNLDWLDTYLPFIVPAAFAGSPFYIFLMVQFLRGLPRELDESAVIDGCSSFLILWKILLPLCKPALFSIGIFHFISAWNDFFNVLIYISSVRNYTLALGLRMSIDGQSGDINWNQIMAMSVVTIVPCVLVFFFSQKYFVQGIATSGLKG